MTASLSIRRARRIALAAQGLARERAEGARHRGQLRRLAAQLGAIQIDSVSVLTRAHYLPAYSRLGRYPAQWIDQEAWGSRPSLFEYWGHMASLIPLDLHPLLRWRMTRLREHGSRSWQKFAREKRDYVQHVLAEIGHRGPVTGGDFSAGRRKAGWWNWSDGKLALEWLFAAGLLAIKTRRGFERVYDLTERTIPASILSLPTPREDDAQRALLKLAASALGVATEGDLRDYFRTPVKETRARLHELLEQGDLQEVRVEGWRQPAYLARGIAVPREVRGQTLLSPFDNLIWRRERAERLFGTRIRLEIYTPAAKREHGYYVLPFLLGDAIVARVDLKSDRKGCCLRVQAAHLESGAAAEAVAPRLAEELRRLASWLELSELSVAKRGNLTRLLRQHV